MSEQVRVIEIAQPDVRNAINTKTAQRLHDAFIAFDYDDAARVAVLTGDAAAFCAGANLKDLPRLRDSGPLGPTRLVLSKPVVAAIEGWCVAGGMELAAWCDLRIAGDTARFGCLERRFGVPLVDGGTYRLPRIVGLGRALDLALSAENIGAEEAHRIGLVSRVVEPDRLVDEAVAFARQVASYPRAGTAWTKRTLHDGLDLDFEAATRLETEAELDAFRSPETRERLQAFVDRKHR
jgi:enoyl-CoA hydratase/carnithine racemase